MIRNELFLLRFLNYLFYLIPITLITGPFLPDFFLVIFCIFFLAYIIIFNKWNFFNNYFFYIMLLFNLYIIILSLFSKNPHLSLESSLFYFRFFLF